MSDKAKPVDKMTVAELKAELKLRGLPQQGLKHELVTRLSEAMQSHGGEPPADTQDGQEQEGTQPTAVDNEELEDAAGNGGEDDEIILEDDEAALDYEGHQEGEGVEDQLVDDSENGNDNEQNDKSEEGDPEASDDNKQQGADQTPEEGHQQHKTQPSQSTQDDGPQEWKVMDIPYEWRPRPLIRVRNIPGSATEDALRTVLESAGLSIQSIALEETKGESKQFALVRLTPPPFPWESTAVDVKLEADNAETATDSEGKDQENSETNGKEHGVKTEDYKGFDADGKGKSIQESVQASVPDADVVKIALEVVKVLKSRDPALELDGEKLVFDTSYFELTLFISNLTEEYDTDEKLRAKVQEYGALERCFVMKNPEGLSKNYAFVEFQMTSAAKKCKDAMDKIALQMRPDFHRKPAEEKEVEDKDSSKRWEQVKLLRAEWASTRTLPALFGKNLYILNLQPDFKDVAALNKVFQGYGEIKTDCHMPKSMTTGWGKGYGFIEFKKSLSADAAFRGTDGTEHPFGKILVSFANPAKYQPSNKMQNRMGMGRFGGPMMSRGMNQMGGGGRFNQQQGGRMGGGRFNHMVPRGGRGMGGVMAGRGGMGGPGRGFGGGRGGMMGRGMMGGGMAAGMGVARAQQMQQLQYQRQLQAQAQMQAQSSRAIATMQAQLRQAQQQALAAQRQAQQYQHAATAAQVKAKQEAEARKRAEEAAARAAGQSKAVAAGGYGSGYGSGGASGYGGGSGYGSGATATGTATGAAAAGGYGSYNTSAYGSTGYGSSGYGSGSAAQQGYGNTSGSGYATGTGASGYGSSGYGQSGYGTIPAAGTGGGYQSSGYATSGSYQGYGSSGYAGGGATGASTGTAAATGTGTGTGTGQSGSGYVQQSGYGSYGQSGYGQSGYGQSGYGQSGYGGAGNKRDADYYSQSGYGGYGGGYGATGGQEYKRPKY